MRKINVWIIVLDHIRTLYDARTNRVSISDILTFYGLPIVCAIYFFQNPIVLPDATNGALIAIFSVFSALLFSAQIALYSLTPKSPRVTGDPISDEKEKVLFLREKRFFSDINANVSYLILLSCLLLGIFLVFLIFGFSEKFEGAALIALVGHFFLTLIMLVKRTHIAFSIRIESH